MKRFVKLYLFYLLLLFGLFYMPVTPLALWLNHLQSSLTLTGLAYFLAPGQLQGIDIIINPHYKIIINQACNGMIPVIFLWASILAYPSKLLLKLLWMVLGYAVFSIVNIIRILIVVYFVEQEGEQSNFYWSHDLLGNAMLMITGLFIFYVFIKRSSLKTV